MQHDYDPEAFAIVVRRECEGLRANARDRWGSLNSILTMARTLPMEDFAAELIHLRVREDPGVRSIAGECAALGDMLVAKNAAYGNSALAPLRIFSQASPAEQIRVRIDDKLSRIARGHAAGEDVVLDLLGYLVLLRIAEGGSDE